jgi:hypothetical protein
MTSGGRPYVNGNRKETTSYLLDGIDINQHPDNVVSHLPSPDALESVAVTSSTASAEWGNCLGGLVTTRLRSGTNAWAGSAFYLLRDAALNATNWASKGQPSDPLNPSRTAPLTHRTYGGTLGGPLVRNGLFVFGDYQGVRRRTGPTNGLATVATPAMRQGDFSALLDGSSPQQLYDPLTTRPDPARSGQYVRDPFPGNRIPLGRFGPVAAALFAHPLYPLPDYAGLAGSAATRSFAELESDQGDVKLDGQIGPNGLSARVSVASQRTRGYSELIFAPGASTYAPMRSAGVRWAVQGAGGPGGEQAVRDGRPFAARAPRGGLQPVQHAGVQRAGSNADERDVRAGVELAVGAGAAGGGEVGVLTARSVTRGRAPESCRLGGRLTPRCAIWHN